MDDWKGEHLIRTVARQKNAGNGWNFHKDGGDRLKSRARAKAAAVPVCAFPGCGKALYDRNKSGLCRTHNHEPGYCRCAQCRRKNGCD